MNVLCLLLLLPEGEAASHIPSDIFINFINFILKINKIYYTFDGDMLFENYTPLNRVNCYLITSISAYFN